LLNLSVKTNHERSLSGFLCWTQPMFSVFRQKGSTGWSRACATW